MFWGHWIELEWVQNDVKPQRNSLILHVDLKHQKQTFSGFLSWFRFYYVNRSWSHGCDWDPVISLCTCTHVVYTHIQVPHSSPASEKRHSLHMTVLHKPDPVNYPQGSVCQGLFLDTEETNVTQNTERNESGEWREYKWKTKKEKNREKAAARKQ